MKNAKQTATAVEEVMNATNLTPNAALEQVKAQDAAKTAVAAEQGEAVAPAKATATKKATNKKNAPQAKQGVKKAKTKPAAKKEAKPAKAAKSAKPSSKKTSKTQPPREFSKKRIVLDLVQRKGGATLDEIMKATGWQAHSVRGFVSGQLMKRMSLPVVSAKNADGARVYSLCGAPHKL